MKLDSASPPEPGRELDLEVARILGYEIVDFHGDHKRYPYVYTGGGGCYLITQYGRNPWTPSTTSAFFSVMEAMDDWCFEFWEEHYHGEEATLMVNMYPKPTPSDFQSHPCCEETFVLSDYPSRVAAYAHAVCACVWKWKTKGGDTNV